MKLFKRKKPAPEWTKTTVLAIEKGVKTDGTDHYYHYWFPGDGVSAMYSTIEIALEKLYEDLTKLRNNWNYYKEEIES